MKTNNQPWSCEHVVERLEALIDGELSTADRTHVDAHVAECEACAGEVSYAAAIKRSLNELPQLRCPESVIVAAERKQPNDLKATWFGMPRWAAATLTLAASIALIGFVESNEPSGSTAGTTEAQRAEQALVELQATLQTQATSVGRKTFERGVAKPARSVVAAVSESPLGRWGAKAASLFASSDAAPSDAT